MNGHIVLCCIVSGIVAVITSDVIDALRGWLKKRERRGIYVESTPYHTNGKGL